MGCGNWINSYDYIGFYIVMIDTLRTSATGLGGFWLSMWGWLPEAVSLSVGIATFVYLVIKIRKELKTT